MVTIIPSPARYCMDCQQCCTVYHIDGLKSAREPCNNLTDDGCSIYNSRPDNCKNFQCMWSSGLGKEEDNPKLSGIILEKRNSNLNPPTIYIAVEVWKDAFNSKKGNITMNRFSQELNSKIIMINFAQDKVLAVYKGEGVE